MKKLIFLLNLFLVSAAPVLSQAHGRSNNEDSSNWHAMMDYMMGGGDYNMMGMGNLGLFGFNWILMILFWALIIGGIILLTVKIIRISQDKTDTPKEKSALDILKERYAKGEINKKEFTEKKKEL